MHLYLDEEEEENPCDTRNRWSSKDVFLERVSAVQRGRHNGQPQMVMGPEGAGFVPPEDSAGTNGKRRQGGRAPSPAGNNVLAIHLFNQGPDCLPDAPSSVSARPPHTAL